VYFSFTIIIPILGKYAYSNAAYDFEDTAFFANCFLLYSRLIWMQGVTYGISILNKSMF